MFDRAVLFARELKRLREEDRTRNTFVRPVSYQFEVEQNMRDQAMINTGYNGGSLDRLVSNLKFIGSGAIAGFAIGSLYYGRPFQGLFVGATASSLCVAGRGFVEKIIIDGELGK